MWDCNVSEKLKLPSPDDHKGRDRAEVLAEAFVDGIAADHDLATYDFIGFSILSDTLPTTLGVIELMRKRCPTAVLLAGNHEATVNLQDCIGKGRLDAVILGDAEEPMLALMRGVEPSKIPGVLWRNFNPKPPREKFEEWNDAIRWGEIPYEAYWKRTASLYDLNAMSEEDRLDKLYEIRTVRVHSLVACELKCTYSVAGDTRVFTEDGPVEIAMLARGLGVVRQCVHGVPTTEYRYAGTVATPNGRAAAPYVIDEGVAPVLEVKTEYGFAIKATPEHLLLCAVDDGLHWKRTDQLKPGDFLTVRRPDHHWPSENQLLTPPELSAWASARIQSGRVPQELDAQLAWLCGYIVGDGCIPKDGRVSFTVVVSPDLHDRIQTIIHDKFGVDLKVYRHKHTTKVKQGWVYSRLARETLIQSIGIDPEDKLRIPAIFWRSPKSVLAAFVEGLFDADGYDSPTGAYLTTISHQLARDVATALLLLGRGCPYITALPPERYRKHAVYRVGVVKQERIPCTRSVYRSESGWKWRTLKQESKHNNGCVGIRRETLRRSGLSHPLDRDGFFYVRVEKVGRAGEAPIFDISVPDGEAFVANGLIAHNCSVANTRRYASGSTKPSIINLSPDALERNLLAIKRSVPGVMTIYDSCDEAWLGRGRAEDYLAVLERIKPMMDEGLPRGMRYLIQCRTNDLDEEIIDRAAKAGVRHLTIGVESPVEQVRKDIKKPQSEDLIRNVIRWGSARGVDMYCLFIMFLPSITLEQLREAVANWRIYMELGATVSVEPFCMAYLGTDLHDDPNYVTEYAGYQIPFSGGKKLKWATLLWPNDRRVCAIEQWFRSNVDEFIAERLKRLGHRHAFKGTTGAATVDCLEAALKLWDEGKIPPWEPGVGVRSKVYQDYGDQMSGAEIAAAMSRPNVTATRFNSTHALLDAGAAQGGVAGRVKDPALPHETLPKKA